MLDWRSRHRISSLKIDKSFKLFCKNRPMPIPAPPGCMAAPIKSHSSVILKVWLSSGLFGHLGGRSSRLFLQLGDAPFVNRCHLLIFSLDCSLALSLSGLDFFLDLFKIIIYNLFTIRSINRYAYRYV